MAIYKSRHRIRNWDDDTRWEYTNEVRENDKAYQRYEKEIAAIAKVESRIQSTVGWNIQHIITGKDNIFTKLEALEILKPSEYQKKNRVREDWDSLCKGWTKETSKVKLNDWINKWSEIYVKAHALKIDKFIDPKDPEPIKDFLCAVVTISEVWAQSELKDVEKSEQKGIFEETFSQLHQRFISHLSNQKRMPKQYIQPSRYNSFAAFRGDDDKDGDSDDEKDDSEPPKDKPKDQHKGTKQKNDKKKSNKSCVCGNSYHQLEDCWFLNANKRPNGWTPKEGKVKDKVEKAVRENSTLQKLARDNNTTDIAAATTAASHIPNMEVDDFWGTAILSDESNTALDMSAFPSSNTALPLRDSPILDSGSSKHIIREMKRFLDYNPAPLNSNVRLRGVGKDSPRVEGSGTAYILVRNPDDTKDVRIRLQRALYVPGCPLNLVSYRQFMENGIHWDSERQVLFQRTKEGLKQHIGRVQQLHNQHVLEYHPIPSKDADHEAYPAIKNIQAGVHISAKPLESAAPASIWHQRMGHPGDELIKNLPKAVDGVTVSDIEKFKTRKGCEVCRLTNAPTQISRRPMDKGTRPWQKVHFDMTFFNKAWNGTTCYVHFYCPYSHDHESVILMQKGHIRQAIMIFHQRLTTLNLTPDTYHSDMEKSLGNEILPHVTATGVSLDLTAPYTPEQNGPAERAGGVINTIARALRIKALLPADMWPVAIEHATYLVRRRPIRALGWKTPYEVVNGQKPNLGNLRIFGCLAFIKRQNMPRKEKLSPKTDIGYLIGYHASNIYKIWCPGAKKIIQVSRDVSFDEDRTFDPYEPVHLISDKLIDSIEEVEGIDNLDMPQPENIDRGAVEEGDDIFNMMERVRREDEVGTQEKPSEFQPTFTPEATPPTLSQPQPIATSISPTGEPTISNDSQRQVLSPESIQAPELDEPMVDEPMVDLPPINEAGGINGQNRHMPPSSRQMEGPSINDMSQRWDISRTTQYPRQTRGISTDRNPNKYPRWEYDDDIADQQRRRIQANEQRLQLLDHPPSGQNQRREAYLSDLEQPKELHGFLQAFSTMLTSGLHTSKSKPNPGKLTLIKIKAMDPLRNFT